MQRPQIPTPALVSHYVQEFDESGTIDKDLTELFKRFPENVQLDHVLIKVSGNSSAWNQSELLHPFLYI